MSMRSLTDLAVARDATAHEAAVSAASNRRKALHGQESAVETTGGALISSITTEVVAAYTTVFALIQALVKGKPQSYVPLRWWLFIAGIVLTVASVVGVYARKRDPDKQKRRSLPVVELFAAVLAFTAWALVMPASALSSQLSRDLTPVVMGLITIGTGAVIALVTGKPLTRGSKTAV